MTCSLSREKATDRRKHLAACSQSVNSSVSTVLGGPRGPAPYLGQVFPLQRIGNWFFWGCQQAQGGQLSTQFGFHIRVRGQQEQRPADGVCSGLKARCPEQPHFSTNLSLTRQHTASKV